MTEFPALQQALIRAAERRRRRRRTLRVSVPAFAAVVAAAAFVLAQPSVPDHERVVDSTRHRLLQTFSVFSTKPTPGDRLPPELAARVKGDLVLTRRVDQGVYVFVEDRGGTSWVCLSIAKLQDVAREAVGCLPERRALVEPVTVMGRGMFSILLPDGVEDLMATYTYSPIPSEPTENVAVFQPADKLLRVSWKDAAGVEHLERVRTEP